MKLIIAGSRTLGGNFSKYWLRDTLDQFGINHEDPDALTEIVCGEAKGIDTLGKYFASVYHIPLISFPADWDKFGKSAGWIRNKQMGDYADALLLIWDGTSSGSKLMKDIMIKLNKPIYEVILRRQNV